eukprot:TRINITY_DN6547_c0_g1_i1.p1 TRINITY_DN6547_c0_g1~~TRINITY_DN6547_c0_g1_i1.p1  ORF type:complete len:626 (-),score=124.84 TRINITY_DN6547_c0_g1_i1:44-1711(-)
MALVSDPKSYLWTDGRYWNQANKELDQNWVLMKVGMPETPTLQAFVAENFPEGANIGVDPRLMSRSAVRDIQSVLDTKKQKLQLITENLVDSVWSDKPSVTPARDIIVLPTDVAGQSVTDKLAWIRGELKSHGAYSHVVTALDAVAWLFNIRGADIDYNPTAIAYAIVDLDNAYLFIHPGKVTKELESHLKESGVTIKDYDSFFQEFEAQSKEGKGKTWVDPSSASAAVFNVLSSISAPILEKDSPITLAKALKNPVELQGMRDCAQRDAVAIVRFFSWLEKEMNSDKASQYDEVDVANKILEFRKAVPGFVSESFGTISSVGANAAVIHYEPKKPSAAQLDKQKIYLCDSGAQYRDGTTDVTRTFHFGTPSEKEKEAFTGVVKGVINLSKAIFPEHTTGLQLDVLARQALWELGLDYKHGTGHGIGHFLNVHEGPHGISFRLKSHSCPLQAGMTTSNEPGYYEDGAFGIRIENDMIVTRVERKYNFLKTGFLGFETITFVPIDTNLLLPEALTVEEKNWLNKYHQDCREKIGPLIPEEDKEAREWLQKRTEPLP